ncbi:MAG TPA: nitrate- and nitrite sensing domain-containing protein [Streptosporangiaceae bacterium]|nr:nitrate- and nitrite sensing domain-containing protein [Streptosporangiaceae bacterium]
MRSRLILLVIIPTVTAVVGGAVFIASSLQRAVVDQRVVTMAGLSNQVTGLVGALQTERQDTVRFIVLGSGGGGRGASAKSPILPTQELRLLGQDYATTDRWASQVKTLAGGIGSSYPVLAQQDSKSALTVIGNLPPIRATATGTQLPPLIVIKEYATAISDLLAVESQIAVGSSDSSLAGEVRVLGLVSSMKEEASQQQALLTSALRPDLVSLGQFGPAQQAALTDAQAQQQGNLSEFGTAATAKQQQLLNGVLSSPSIVQAQAQEQQAISLASSNSPIATDPTVSDASSALGYVVTGMRSAEQQFASSALSRGQSLHNGAIALAVIYGLAVALLLGIALITTLIIGRSMVRPLRRLRNGALEVAEDRLPEAVRRINEAGGDGIPADVEPIDVDSSDEIGEVARAFDQVHQEAVRLAGNEAALRGNVSTMFISLSRRSVPLIDRLSRMIDSLELTEDDPDRLSDLFSMDHLVTRMRRNSENLLVLAGEEPVRKWSEPVPLTDVVRAAASEIEQYGRVLLEIQPGIVVSGHAAADVVHLLAEIIENATTFSPDQTPVRVFGQEVSSGGVMLEVTDRGIGISPGRLTDMNWRLENPPLIDVSVSQHMGLFAVSRLAARSGVRIRLRAATPQGLSALVWLPGTLAGRETARDAEERSRRMAEAPASSAALRPGGRRGRSGAAHAAGGNRRASNWFRAQRPSEQRVPAGAPASAPAAAPVRVPAAPIGVPAAGTAMPAPAAPAPVMSASGLPTRQASSRQAPSPGARPAGGPVQPPVTGPPQPPAAADLMASGLPLRRPGANLFPGSIGGDQPGDSAPDEAQEAGAPDGTPDSPGTGGPARPPRQGPPLRRSPDSVRSRLSGFQLGSREAESGMPGAGEESTR